MPEIRKYRMFAMRVHVLARLGYPEMVVSMTTDKHIDILISLSYLDGFEENPPASLE